MALHFPINKIVVGRIGLQTPTPVPISRVGEIFVGEAHSRCAAKQRLFGFVIVRRQNKRLRTNREEHRVLVVHGHKRSEDRIVAQSCGRRLGEEWYTELSKPPISLTVWQLAI